MSFRDCIEDAVRGGVLDRQQAEQLYLKQRDYEATFRLDLQHSAESAARLGEAEAIKAAKRATRHARYQAAKQAILNSQNVNNVRAHPRGTAKGIGSLLGRDLRGEFGQLNVDYLQKTITGQAHAKMAEFLSAARTTHVGFRQDKALIRNVVRELFASQTGDARAAKFAKSWTEVSESLRQRFNRAGGGIPRRADWGLPQSHDRARVAQVDRATWVDFVKGRLDRDAMTNSAGGRLSDDELDIILQDIYETIRTDGLSNLVPGARGGKKLANRRQDHRVLVFRDADNWLEYQDRFGKPNLFQTMTDHVSAMAHDIALLETLGPNPNAGFRYLMDVAARDGMSDTARAYNESLFRTVNGATDTAGSVLWLADATDSVLSWLVAAKLGSAALSAVSDVGFVGMTSSLNGLKFTRVMSRMLTQLNPANEADRIIATRMGLTAMQWSRAMATANRYSNVQGRGLSGRAAEVTLRASGLTAWTDAWKRAFGMEFYANLGENLGRDFADLPERLRLSLERYDIDAAMWNDIRKVQAFEHDGARFVSVENILEHAALPLGRREELSNKLGQMVLSETAGAIPEPDARARVFTSGAFMGSGAPGSVSGVLGRSLFQFKGFPVSALLFHVYRAANLKDGSMNPLAYAAGTILATTLLGAFALQLKEISRGKNPRDMADHRFWGAALAQGGGLGIYGDFLMTDVNRFGGGLTSTLAGPVVPLINDTAKLTLGQLHDIARGDEMNFAAELLNYTRKYAPGGSIWYTRLLLEREIMDQLQLAVDDKAYQSFRRRMRTREREYNQSYWWRQGEKAPRSPPDLAEALQFED